MIKRKWTEKSSKIPMKIAGQNPVGYQPTGRRHAPNEPNRRDQGTTTTGAGTAGDRLSAQPQPQDRGQVHEGRGLQRHPPGEKGVGVEAGSLEAEDRRVAGRGSADAVQAAAHGQARPREA